MNKAKTLLKMLILICLVYYLFTLVDWNKVRDLNINSVIAIISGLIIYLILTIPMATRWRHLVNMQYGENKFPLLVAYRGYLVGRFFNIFMPGSIGGDMARIKYCKDFVGMKIKESVLIVTVERLFALTALCILFTVGLVNNLDMFQDLNISLYGTIVVLLLTVITVGAIKYWISKHIKINRSTFFLIIFFSILAPLADIVSLLIISLSVGVRLEFVDFMFIVPLVYIATILPISFGGLGVREGAMTGLLYLFGIPAGDGVLISFLAYIVIVLLGLVGGVVYMLRVRKKV